ncbi:hypothetical protein Pta02_15820 [Planobispora takensis]|uniref:Uncharacterized protein n=1 Tax=Planobispora takensis TaxID=1367882 RepID=A0A8J3WRH9_9ACTN|nr:hypothetical protein Pta02_15820 [Planobispora takensis]
MIVRLADAAGGDRAAAKLGDGPFAVRSSAVAEDLSEASYADGTSADDRRRRWERYRRLAAPPGRYASSTAPRTSPKSLPETCWWPAPPRPPGLRCSPRSSRW